MLEDRRCAVILAHLIGHEGRPVDHGPGIAQQADRSEFSEVELGEEFGEIGVADRGCHNTGEGSLRAVDPATDGNRPLVGEPAEIGAADIAAGDAVVFMDEEEVAIGHIILPRDQTRGVEDDLPVGIIDEHRTHMPGLDGPVEQQLMARHRVDRLEGGRSDGPQRRLQREVCDLHAPGDFAAERRGEVHRCRRGMGAGSLSRVDDEPSDDQTEQEADEENASKDALKTFPLRLVLRLHSDRLLGDRQGDRRREIYCTR